MLKYDKKQKVAAWDFETEGLNLVHSKPWQLAWVICQGDKVIDKQDRYIYFEDLKVSKEAAAVTGFKQSVYDKRAEPPEVVLGDFDKVLYDSEIVNVGQNLLGFDIFVHNQLRRRCGLASDFSYLQRLLDTRCLEVAIETKSTYNNNPLGKIGWQFQLLDSQKSAKVKAGQLHMLKKYGIPFDEKKLHDAIYDVEMTNKILQKQVQLLDI